MPRKLGVNQKGILFSLVEHGRWHGGCGWIWSNRSETIRLLDSLVKRGLATREETGPRGPYGPSPLYRPTEQGRAVAFENSPGFAARMRREGKA